MQKKVIALAVAALASGAAMAQSNVTVYGWLDAEYQSVAVNNAALTNARNYRGIDDGQYGSRLGFKGEEALGGGLKAFFDLEYGIGIANSVGQVTTDTTGNSATNINTRHSLVGFSHNDFGTLGFGRIETIGRAFSIATRPWGGIADTARFTGQRVLGMDINSADRLSNALSYQTPVWAGFQATLQHSTDKNDNGYNDIKYGSNAGNQVQLNGTQMGRQPVTYLQAEYTLGGFNAAAIYKRQQRALDTTAERSNAETGLRASYDFKVVKVGASWQQIRKNTVSSNFDKGYMWGAFVNVPVGEKVNVALQYNQSKASNLATANNFGDIGAKAWALNASYDFSKRTQVYAQYAYYKTNDGNASLASNPQFNGYNMWIEPGKTVNALGVGMLHKF